MRRYLPMTLLYVVMLIAVFSAYQPLTRTDNNDLLTQDGLADVSSFDLSTQRARIHAYNWEYYPLEHYTPEDFAAGNTVAPVYNGPDTPIDFQAYGTFRLQINLPAGRTYGMTGRSFLFSQRLYIGGALAGEVGSPGKSAQDTTPRTNSYAYYFTPEQETTEIIFHVADFQMGDGGGAYSFTVGEAPLIERYRIQHLFGSALLFGCLMTVFLFFLGMFLFSLRRRYFLFFAISNLLLAVRSLLVGEKPIMELFPALDWHLCIRGEYIGLVLLVVFLSLYISTLYPKLLPKWVWWVLHSVSGLYILVILLTDPMTFPAFLQPYCIIWGICGAAVVVRMAMELKRRELDRTLVFLGFLIFILAGINDALQYVLPFYMRFHDVAMVGMVICVFINMIALTLSFERTETALAQTRQKEQELKQANRLLDSLNHMKTEFMANISHEMRTPLTVMSSNAQLSKALIKKEPNREKIDKSLDYISDEAARLARLVSELLAVSNLHGSQQSFTPVDLGGLLHQSAEIYRALLKKKGNELVLTVPEKLPHVMGNADMLVQVIINLLANANAHTQEGTVTLEAKQGARNIHVSVKDTGEGIAPDLLPHIFERSVRSDDSGGSGLGLSICQDVIERHNGAIEVYSVPGQGTSILFTLPHMQGGNRND